MVSCRRCDSVHLAGGVIDGGIGDGKMKSIQFDPTQMFRKDSLVREMDLDAIRRLHSESRPIEGWTPERAPVSRDAVLTESAGLATSSKFVPSTEFPDMRELFKQPATEHCQTTMVSDVMQAPYSGVGRLLFRTPGGGQAAGTAWICGDNLIGTCAHNLYDRQGWCDEITFWPAYNHYSDSADAYTITRAIVHKNWGLPRNPLPQDDVRWRTAFDIAICEVDRVFSTEYTRIPFGLQEELDAFDDNEFLTLGYPGGTAFDFGQRQFQCRGKYLWAENDDARTPHCPVKATTIGSGASGGPWVRNYDGVWLAIGLNSGPASSNYFAPEINPQRTKIMSMKSPFFSEDIMQGLRDTNLVRTF